ncbi:PIR Superfamily Protein [Plasmodium ovale curtisi]|uniref:PIR Superfamily Protein n=1 Tax=Plasmodium ovale curtisi TaxID=864141 RepID=A0A1A8X9L6_PLAOA|nr:PIR Superfamily Protein [Plasmodium ovale curtisi]
MNLKLDDLPTIKFYNELSTRGKFDLIDNNVEAYTISKNINEWITSFKNEIGNFIKNTTEWKGGIPGKRCRDWHYYINFVKDKINDLKEDNTEIKLQWLEEIDKFSQEILNYNNVLECTTDDKNDYANIYKKWFDDLCENCYYINDNLENINISSHCQEYFSYLLENKSILDSFIEAGNVDFVYKSFLRGPKKLSSAMSRYINGGNVRIFNIIIPCTSFGSRSHKSILRKRNDEYKLEEEMYELSENTSEHNFMYSGNRPYHITYQNT